MLVREHQVSKSEYQTIYLSRFLISNRVLFCLKSKLLFMNAEFFLEVYFKGKIS